MGITDAGVDALEMARAILGDSRVVRASFKGSETASGSKVGGGLVLSAGRAGKPNKASTSYIDIDFIPDSDFLRLDFELDADAIPLEDTSRFISDGVSIWVDGALVAMGPRPSRGEPTRGSPRIPVGEVGTGTQIGFGAIIGLTSGQVNTLRIATAALGTAGLLSLLTVKSAEAAPGGNPGPSSGGGMVAEDDIVDISIGGSTTLDPLANDVAPGQSIIFITEINGVAVAPGDTVTLTTGETITIGTDGTVVISADGDPSSFTFEYTAAYGKGNAKQSDTATVTVNTVPCFVAGTMIRTEKGDIPVEHLQIGQKVQTRDDGLQPIRWIGRRKLPAEGKMAPVRIAADTFGNHGTLMVSPLHRILVQNAHAELLFGSSEVLIAARDLIDDNHVRQIMGGQVEYVHLLFDRHQVVWSDGLLSESFLPGPQTTNCFEEETIAEITNIFPELDPRSGEGYGPAARPALKRFEARLLVA